MAVEIEHRPVYDSRGCRGYSSIDQNTLVKVASDFTSASPRVLFLACESGHVALHGIPAEIVKPHTLSFKPSDVQESLATGTYCLAEIPLGQSYTENYRSQSYLQELTIKNVVTSDVPRALTY